MEVFMNFINAMFGSILSLDPVSAVKMVVMWAIGGTLIYLAIKKDMEPSLLLPMGFGAILVNLPLSGAIDQMHELGIEVGALSELFRAGISNELFPLLLFIGIGAMIDFGPLLANPKLLLFGAAAQFGIFMTLTLACLVNLIFPGMFSIQDAASVAIIGAADEYGSGLTLERPALQKVTEAVVAGKVDVVIVHSLTRIGREWGMTQSYIDLLTRHKVKLLCIRDRLLFDENGAAPILTIKNAECPL